MGGRDADPLAGQMARQPRQRPAGERDPLRVGAGAGHGHDPRDLIGRDPAGSPAPPLRVQGVKPTLVEGVNHLPHMRVVALEGARDLGRAHPGRRGQKDHRPLAARVVFGPPRQPFEPLTLIGAERPHEHLGGTHRDLLRSDASQFHVDRRFPVERLEKAH